MPRKPTDFKPSGGRQPTNFQAAQDTPITNRVGEYFEPKIVDLGEEMVETLPNSTLSAKMGIPRMQKPMSGEDVVRLASTAATFGQQPRISALTESAFTDKPYDESLKENQEMLAYIRKKHPAGAMAIEIPVSLAATAPMTGASLLGRIGIGAGLGAGYGSEQQDLGTAEGVVNTGLSAGLGAGAGFIPNIVKGGSDFVKKAVAEASEGGTTIKNLIRDYIVKKNKPEILETLLKKPNTIVDLATVGSDEAKTTLQKAIAPFREEALANENPIVPELVDEINLLKKARDSFGTAKKTVLDGGQIHFLTDVQRRMESPMSPKDMLNTVDLLDSKIEYGAMPEATNIDRRFSKVLKPIRDAIKNKLRDPASEWGSADKAFSTFLKDEPAVEALEQAKFDFAKKTAQSDFPKLEQPSKVGYVHPSAKGVVAKALAYLDPRGGLKYTDQLSEDIAQKLVNPELLMKMIQEGDREIVPNVTPTGLYKILEIMGAFDKPIGGVSPYNALANELASQSPKILNEE